MTIFEVTVERSGQIKQTGEFFYDFTDPWGRKWKIITEYKPSDTKRMGFMTGNMIPFSPGRLMHANNAYRPRLQIFLGALVNGKIEIGDIKIKREEH